jgi:ABC-type lipoprotein release transport system permease subunit
MNRTTLVLRSLRFYRRTHLGVAAGCAVSAAVLVGALFVGDSVRGSLARIARDRLGRIEVALETGNRHFRDDLAARLGAGAAAALRVQGMAIREDRQVNRVEVIGVDARFLALAARPAAGTLAPGEVALGERLAAALGARPGDEIALRIFKPAPLSRDAPLASRKERETRRALVTVKAVLSDAELGRFSLRSDQASPSNAFVHLPWLQGTLDLEGRANLLAAGGPADLGRAWEIEDAGLEIRAFEKHGLVQLESPRIYLDPAVLEAAPGLASPSAASVTYLVNSIASERGTSTPYSFMAAVSPGALGPLPPDMKDDEIVVNRWVADRLSVREGDRIDVGFWELGPGDRYVEKSRSFRLRGVAPMESLARERALAPEFPSLTDVDSCKDWDIDLPLDQKKLEDKENEAYWKAYRQTPKAFVTLAAGRAMWANRFGDVMAFRYPASATDPARLRAAIRARIDPARVGLALRPVREEALRAVSESMDLGQLFLGMSAFLVAASLLLTAMLFVFTVEQRAREVGVLLATGHPPGGVRWLLLAEGAVLALAGSLAGVPLGWAFAKLLVGGLASFWSGAVAGTPIEFHAGAASALWGASAAAAISILAMRLALSRHVRRPVRELVAEEVTLAAPSAGRGRARKAIFLAGTAGAAGIALATLLSGTQNPSGAFFAAGALALAGGIALIRILLARSAQAASPRLSVSSLGARSAARRPGRALATAGMLACGSFIVLSVSAMKEDLSLQAGERSSGTGGFRLYSESSVPIHKDKRDLAERRLSDDPLRDVSSVRMRLREGDDASCVNLNQASAPPLLGVDPAELARRGAFAGPELWKLLDAATPPDVVPAIVGDSATAVWKLKKRVGKDGDLIEYKDDRGRPFKVKLVAALPMRLSVLQGRLVIAERDFTRLYPSESGYRVILWDVPAEKQEALRLGIAARDWLGLDVVPSVERLKGFYAVETTYLLMFLVLGGLGLLLGSAGMAVLVLRNVLERRGELALLRAVGYSKEQIGRVVMAEHRWLLAAGLGAGTLAAALAVAPGAARPEVHVPVGLLAFFLAGTAALSLAWIWAATRLALRAPLLGALRNE